MRKGEIVFFDNLDGSGGTVLSGTVRWRKMPAARTHLWDVQQKD